MNLVSSTYRYWSTGVYFVSELCGIVQRLSNGASRTEPFRKFETTQVRGHRWDRVSHFNGDRRRRETGLTPEESSVGKIQPVDF